MHPMQQASIQRDDWDITTGVGITALAVAAGRAMETRNPGGLVTDPYAEAFVSAADSPVPMPTEPPEQHDPASIDGQTSPGDEQQLWATAAGHMGVRSRFFDDCLTGATRAGIRQVVVLAAGLDTRAYRLDWPVGTAMFELDQPAVLEFKDHVLVAQGAQPACHRIVVPVDLRDAWQAALTATGFDPAAPSVWLAEGLLPYLPGPTQHALVDGITALAAPGSRLAVEYFCHLELLQEDPTLVTMAQKYGIDFPALLAEESTASTTGDAQDPETGLHSRGWQAESHSAAEIAGRYQRRFVPFSEHMNPDDYRYLTASLPGQAGARCGETE